MSASSRDDRLAEALDELQSIIVTHYPTATFEVGSSPDDAASVHLRAIADVDDADEVLDLVIDHVLELQVDEGLPIHVIPVRTPERIVRSQQLKRRPSQALTVS